MSERAPNTTPNRQPDIDAQDIPKSRVAERLRSATQRVAGFLDRRAAGRPERQAARAERMEHVKGFRKKITESAFKFLEGQGIIPLRSTWSQQGGLIAKYVSRRRNAQQRKEARLNGNGFLSAEQAAAAGIDTEPEIQDPPIDTDTTTADTNTTTPGTPDTNTTANANETADVDTDTTQPEQVTDPDVEVAVAETRADRARARRQQRRERREERRANRAENREQSGNLRQRAVAAARKIGNSALGNFFKRAKAAGSKAVGAGFNALRRS